MNHQLSEQQLDSIRQFRLPEYREIPNVGLYLDQSAKFINEYLKVLPGRGITLSMIANYVKMKLIDNPIRRQYYRPQIAELIFISLTKGVISLEDIRKLLQLAREQDLEAIYNRFARQFESSLRQVFGLEENKLPEAAESSIINDVITAVVHAIHVEECCRALTDQPQ